MHLKIGQNCGLNFTTDHGLRREENKFEFFQGRFLDEKLLFLHKKKKKKNEHHADVSLFIIVTFTALLTLKCRTLSLKLRHFDSAAAIFIDH